MQVNAAINFNKQFEYAVFSPTQLACHATILSNLGIFLSSKIGYCQSAALYFVGCATALPMLDNEPVLFFPLPPETVFKLYHYRLWWLVRQFWSTI
jgi:hypothetical protein